MPQTKRRFADDDPPTDESSEDPPDEYVAAARGGGKQLRMMSGGGKQLVRQQESEEESSSEEEEEEAPEYRGGGKQFRHSGGKQLRVAEPDSDSDDDEDEEDETHQVTAVQRGGGKSLIAMQRSPGGGKQLRPTQVESDSDESEQEEEQVPPSFSGGKQLHRPPPSEEDDDAMDVDSDDDEEEPVTVTAAVGGGKALRPPMGGKQLRPPPVPEPAKPPPPAKKAAVNDDMEESSSSEEEQELDMETFDTQTLVKDEADQKHLDSLPEIEREAILGERFDKLKAAQDMRIALRESKRKEREERRAAAGPKAKKKSKKTKKQEASDAALAAKLSSARGSQRNRDAKGAKKKRAEALKAFREERKSLLERKEEEEEEDSDLDFGDDDDDSDDDYEEKSFVAKPWQQKKKTLASRSSKQLKDESSSSSSVSSDDEGTGDRVSGRERGPDAELADYIKVTIPRRRLAQWCNEPYFEKVVMHCFVRLGVGEVDGKKCYRLCEIVDVVKSKSEYKFPALNKASKPVYTNKALRLKIGKNEKEFPMYLVSDSRPTDEDMQKYLEIQKSSRMDLLSRGEAKKLRKNLDEVVHNYKYTHEDIEKAVEARKKRGKGLANIGLEQTRSKIAVQAAKSGVDEAKRQLDEAKKALLEYSGDDNDLVVAELEKKVESAQVSLEDAQKVLEERLLEEERVKTLAKDRKRRLTKRAKDRNWAKVNERAAMVNQAADFDSYKADREKAKSSDGTTKFNPYARRKVKPKMLWEVGQTKNEGEQEESANKETRDEADASKTAAPTTPMTTRDDHVEALSEKADVGGQSHQFAIDEDVLAQANGSSLGMFGMNSSKPKIARVRKGLSFQEYKDRKAAGTL